MTRPSLSIVIPLFNCEECVEACISSITDELADCDELLIVDDGSTDGSIERARNAIADCLNAKLILKDNGGVSSARNMGLEVVRGEYVMFVDADDALLPGWRSASDRAIEHSGGADVITFSRDYENTNAYSAKDIVDAMIGFSNSVSLQAGMSACSKLFKLAAVNKCGARFEEGIIHGEDALFNIKMLLNTDSHWFEGASIYRYRMREGSATHSYSNRFLLSNILYLKSLRRILSESPEYDEPHVEACIELSFVNSVFLYAKRLASTRDLKMIRDGSRLLYENLDYAQLLARSKSTCAAAPIASFAFALAKLKLLTPLAFLFSLFLRIRPSKESWIEI
ncbi:glycosyltransferase family 2 protein [Enorma massiliensis]|uniref:Glycosyltransferase 2-like domain-containing protein n=1 Tax=Enorma massiliensis TaxID=1472761 RepID=A0A1Y3U1G8_9ACTN|nr:glycosyltransferase family 2 protein [Enorma massiliensis]OUN42601.1 hypothetical protein B5G21_07155 [Enorma massiliensis]